jgi:hypothetical protein
LAVAFAVTVRFVDVRVIFVVDELPQASSTTSVYVPAHKPVIVAVVKLPGVHK